jgi:hypothetical protein
MNTLEQNKPNQETKVQHNTRTLGFQDLILLTTLVIIAAFVRCGNMTEESNSNFPVLTTTTEVVTNQEDFIGKTLTMRSNPGKKVGLSSFTLNDRQQILQEPILVVNASGQPFDLPTNPNRKIEVTGQVRNLVIPEIERDFRLNLQEQYYREFINKPVIIAQSIRLVD